MFKLNMTPEIKIYRNGQFDALATYKPVIRRKLIEVGNKVDYLFVNGRWPTEAL